MKIIIKIDDSEQFNVYDKFDEEEIFFKIVVLLIKENNIEVVNIIVISSI